MLDLALSQDLLDVIAASPILKRGIEILNNEHSDNKEIQYIKSILMENIYLQLYICNNQDYLKELDQGPLVFREIDYNNLLLQYYNKFQAYETRQEENGKKKELKKLRLSDGLEISNVDCQSRGPVSEIKKILKFIKCLRKRIKKKEGIVKGFENQHFGMLECNFERTAQDNERLLNILNKSKSRLKFLTSRIKCLTKLVDNQKESLTKLISRRNKIDEIKKERNLMFKSGLKVSSDFRAADYHKYLKLRYQIKDDYKLELIKGISRFDSSREKYIYFGLCETAKLMMNEKDILKWKQTLPSIRDI